MKLLFLTHYYPPESNAPASRTYEHCVRWAREGHDVTVVTCVPNCPAGVVFDGYRNRIRRQVEVVDGVRVVRVWTWVAPNAGTVRRIANYVSYMISAIVAAVRLPRPDVVVATSPQFFCGWAGVWVSRLKRAPLVLEVRDIWPESIGTVGAIRNRFILRFLEWLERRLYRSADHIVAVGEGYKARILERVDIPDLISVVTNGVDVEQFVPQPPDEQFLRENGLDGKFICSYIGTIGMAHGLEVTIEAARILKSRGRDDVRFCLVGDGAQRQQLQDMAQRAGVEDVIVFTGRQPKDRMPAILASSDACLIHLRACELFGSVIPSKIFETMAMGRPIIMGVRGEARQIVAAAQAGLDMEPESAESLVACVLRLADGVDLRARLGISARSFVEQYYNRDDLARRMLHAVMRAAGTGAVAPAEPALTPHTILEPTPR
jgi:glycosyltransferase involved in cell wall biosynthesis